MELHMERFVIGGEHPIHVSLRYLIGSDLIPLDHIPLSTWKPPHQTSLHQVRTYCFS